MPASAQRQKAAQTALSATSGLGPHHAAPVIQSSPRPRRAGSSHVKRATSPQPPRGGKSLMPNIKVNLRPLSPVHREQLKQGLEAQQAHPHVAPPVPFEHGNPRSVPFKPGQQNGGPLAGVGHLARGLGHAAGALGHEVFGAPLEYNKALVEGDRAKAERIRHEMEAFNTAVSKSLVPASVMDIAHGHAPSGKHAGEDALFFLPWSRGLRAAGEGIKAAAVAEDTARASEASARAAESFKSGKGLGDAAAGGVRKLLPSERALSRSAARQKLFQHIDTHLPRAQAQAVKRTVDQSIKTLVRNGHAKNVDDAIGRLAKAHTDIQSAKVLGQEAARGHAAVRGRLFDHFDRNLGEKQAQAHKDVFDASVNAAVSDGEHVDEAASRLAAIHGSLADEVRASGITHPADEILHQDFTEPPASAGEVAMRAAQQRGIEYKGAFELTDQGQRAIIHLTHLMDVTTVPHELGHFLEHFGLAPEDKAVIEKWTGPLDNPDAHEKFARGLEAYIRSGEAPNNLKAEFKVLQPAFHDAYPSVGELPQLTPEIAGVYKKLLGHRDGLSAAIYFSVRNRVAAHSLAAAAMRGPQRDEGQVQDYLAQQNEQAVGEGFGGKSAGKVVELRPGETTPETGGALGELVRGGLNDPSGLRGVGQYERTGAALDNAPKTIGQMHDQQEAARGVALSRKAGSLHAAQQDALTADNPYQAFMAAGAARKGMLPKSDFKGFDALEPHLNDLTMFVGSHPNLQPFARQKVMEAITRGITENRMPAAHERRLIAKAFGREASSGFAKAVKRGEVTVADILNIPRAAMSSGDLSAGLRQGLASLFYKPNIFFDNWTGQFKYLLSEGKYQEAQAAIEELPTYAMSRKGKVSYTDIGDDLNAREEAYGSQLAEQIPVVGHLIRASDRAYTGFLNALRAHLFDHMVRDAAAKGWNLDQNALESIGSVVNALTGRGNLPEALAEHRAFLNGMFFSPGLAFSRLNFLGFGGSHGWKSWLPGSWYVGLHPYARREALKTLRNLTGGLSTILWFAHMAGASVSLDPRNADFGKIRVGDTRFDVAGGFQQWVRLISELSTGQIVSSTTGRLENLGGSNSAQKTRLDAALQFLEGKAAPVPATAFDLLRGTGFDHQPIKIQNELAQHVIPLVWQDMWDIAFTGPPWNAKVNQAPGAGLKMAGIASIPDILGVGVQNYSAPGPKTNKDTHSLLDQSKEAGLPAPPQAVMDDVPWKAKLDAATYSGQKPIDKAKAVIDLFDQKYGTDLTKTVLPHITTEGQAEALYQELRAKLFPALSQWQSAVNSRLNYQKGTEQVPSAPAKSSAPSLDVKPTAYHVPASEIPGASNGVQATDLPAAKQGQGPQVQEAVYHPPSQGTAQAAPPTPTSTVQPTGVVPDALTLAADQGLSDLASGQYSPSRALSQLFQTLASQPLQNTVQTPDGLHIRFQIPKLTGPLGKAQRGAVALAQAYLGTPYVWGGESPAGFDCSGLAQYVYAKLGIDIPRTSGTQFRAGAAVPKSRLQAGDLVFFVGSDGTKSDPGHVGIYIGGGKFIEAPHTGATVRVSSLAGYPGYVGARRYAKTGRKAA